MKVQEIMSTRLETCRPEDTLERAAQIMWDCDCGVVPVVGDDGKVVGMITDRDICMAAYTQGRPLGLMLVSSACSRSLRSCAPDDPIEEAEAIMAAAQVRRLPVIDGDGRLCGIVSLADFAHRVRPGNGKPDGLSLDRVAATLAAISQPAPS
jgi:CBS domain-containing protein